jgi:Protein of unknown function (DUF2652)
MENRGLLFIPDISGFTRFVSETEIEHSRLVIQELLEILINANQIDLKVSEVEGDAILFYKFGESPGVEVLYKQVEKMFCDFHRHISAYDYRKFCQCTACRSAIDLTLKVVTHYGEFTGYNVKTFNKLIGKDIIVAHQLLKNDITEHEYWLVTNNLLPGDVPAVLPAWMDWSNSVKQTENGEIPFRYAQLGKLKDEIKPEPLPSLQLSRKRKVITVTKDYDAHIIVLFHATGDFTNRYRWWDGVKSVEEITHFLPRIGMKCRCITDTGEMILCASSYSYHPEKIEFSETNEKDQSTIYYTLEKKGDTKTRLTLDYYLPKGKIGQILFTWGRKKKMEAVIQQSLMNLANFVKEVNLPAESLRDY